MISFALGLVIGLVGGFIWGLFFYAKKVHKRLEKVEVTRETINAIIKGDEPKGEIVEVNRVAEFIKNNDSIALGDVIEE